MYSSELSSVGGSIANEAQDPFNKCLTDAGVKIAP